MLTFSLLETIFRHDLLADEVRSSAALWVTDVNEMGRELKGEKLDQLAWQKKIEELMARVDLADLLQLIDFERLSAGVKFSERGERSLRFAFPKVEGVPSELSFGKQIFALKKDRSVVPHGHNNMATAFLILKGDLHGRHYDRIRDEARAHDHPAHHRPNVQPGRVLDGVGLQGQRALVSGDHGAGVHLQFARDGREPGEQAADGPRVYRPDG